MPSLVNISEAASLALHTMGILAQEPEGRFTTHELASRLKASSNHLAKVMQRLARAELVHSARGPQGGFQLARPAHSIRLLEIYEAVEGHVGDQGCLLGQPICDGHDCVLGEFIQKIHREIRDYLARMTLAEMGRGSALVKMTEIASGPT